MIKFDLFKSTKRQIHEICNINLHVSVSHLHIHIVTYIIYRDFLLSIIAYIIKLYYTKKFLYYTKHIFYHCYYLYSADKYV